MTWQAGSVLDRPPASQIPDAPGSYQFYDSEGRVIYVGKARSLRQRLANYFQSPLKLPPRTAQMVAAATRVEWIQVHNDAEALMLEYSLIKEHRPRFNIRLRDDKSYPWLAVTTGDTWPRPVVMRGQRRKGVRYFGPYPHAYAIRETLDLLLRSFPIRSCSDGKFTRHERLGRPCLLYHIEKCVGPCTGRVGPSAYGRLVGDLMATLDGDTDAVAGRLREAMGEASLRLEFELAARLRDRLAAVDKVVEKQQVVTDRREDIDVIGFAEDGLEIAVQVFHVRHGRIVGRRGFVVDAVEEMARQEFVTRVVTQLYGGGGRIDLPKQLLVPELPDDIEALSEWLCAQRGGRVAVAVPKRGRKRALLSMVESNAKEELGRHRLRRASDHNARAKALTELQEALGLPEAPLRIECYDMSHLQGTDYVGSMVVMEDGLPKRSDYRRFKVRTVAGNDDYAAMGEVLERRLSALKEESAGPIQTRRRFAYPPQLILIDGGKGQLGVGVKVLADLGLADAIPLASLAKQFEEVYLPGRSEPLRLARGSEALYLLQRIRDEAHRFAISYHRRLRSRRSKASVLDGIAGLGPTRRKRLLAEVGGLRGLQEASHDDLVALSWLPNTVGEAVWEALHSPIAANGPAPDRGRDGLAVAEGCAGGDGHPEGDRGGRSSLEAADREASTPNWQGARGQSARGRNES